MIYCFLRSFVAVVLLFSSVISTGWAERSNIEVEIYIAPNGRDDAEGTKASPLATLSAAVRKARGNGRPTTIWLAPGRYRVDSTVQLTQADSRDADAPLTIRGPLDKSVLLTSASDIAPQNWRPLDGSDRLASLVPKPSRPHVAVTDISPDDATGEVLASHQGPLLLAWKGFILNRSRWPNSGYGWIDKVLDRGPSTRHLKLTESPPEYSFEKPSGGRFTIKGSALDLRSLQQELSVTGDVEVRGYLHNDWYYQIDPIARANVEEHSIQLLRHTRYGIENDRIPLPRRFRIVNAISQLDQPGEWYFDAQENKIYLWPVRSIQDDADPISLVAGKTIISGSGVKHIRLIGLTFEGFAGNGVSFEQSDHLLVAGCTFRSGGNRGLRLEEGSNNTVQSCDFHDLKYALSVEGRSENRLELVPENNLVINNHVWNCRARGYGAITVKGVGAKFMHNLVHGQNSGLVYGDNDFLAMYNEFYDMGNEMGDWNACYRGADLSLLNNVFRYNFFHHFMETPGAYPIAAIRADDGASGLIVDANLMYKTGRAATQFNGPNCQVTHNFVMEVPMILWTLGHADGNEKSREQFMERKRAARSRIEQEVEQGLKRPGDKDNIIAKAEFVFGAEGWKKNRSWVAKYPTFSKYFDFHDFHHCPWAQSFAVVADNFIAQPEAQFPFHIHKFNKSGDFEAARQIFPNTATIEMPETFEPQDVFVDVGQLDLSFKKERSPAGPWEGFDFDKVGLIRDQYRTTLPPKRDYRNKIKTKYAGIRSDTGELDLEQINQRFEKPEYLNFSE